MVTEKFKVGLTGGIGSGKSTVANLFVEKGITLIDADQLARDVVAPGEPVLQNIAIKFGDQALNTDGSLNRTFMRNKVFSDDANRAWLNSQLHPLIRSQMEKAIHSSQSPYCIVDVPLLTENKMGSQFDVVLVVDCEESLQLKRASQRDKATPESIQAIIDRQATRKERLAIADDVIANNTDIIGLKAQVERLHEKYLQLSSTK